MYSRLYSLFLAIALTRCEALSPSMAGKLNQVVFAYPTSAQSERDLNICPENSACNIIHKRFWLPPLIERLCRCPQRKECKWTWSEDPDNYTMMLDNRSQMKFCSDLSDLPTCTLKKPAIRIVTNLSNMKLTGNTTKSRTYQKTFKPTFPKNVTALCHCNEIHYWKLKPNSTKADKDADTTQQFFLCSKLKKCVQSEFCGYVRTDTYSTYYRCSCPKGHLCISKDKTVFKADEMLYNGYGYKALCFPVQNKTETTRSFRL